MESKDFQEKVVRIRIKQSIWHSGPGRQDLHVFVGVLWVRLSAENEVGSFERSGRNLEVVHTTRFPQIVQPPFSPGGLRGVTCRSEDTSRCTDSCPGFKEEGPRAVSSPCSLSPRELHKKQGAIGRLRRTPKSATSKARVPGKVLLFHRHSPFLKLP